MREKYCNNCERVLANLKDLIAERDELKVEVERLKEYHEHVWKYVQDGNTSYLFAGHHVAKALVMDHSKLKEELTREHEAAKILREALETLKVAVNDKVEDKGATAFITRTLAKVDKIMGVK